VAVLQGGEDSFAIRLQALKNAQKSIRIQALVFKGDETGLRIAEILKQKKAAGLDVRVIIDAFSNPWLQTQWMFFDLKQNGIEVEGYEAMALQWLNEVPVRSSCRIPTRSARQAIPREDVDRRRRDGSRCSDHGRAGTSATSTSAPNPDDPDSTWRDQDVVVRGSVVGDLVTAFDRNFDYFVGVKRSRGAFNTNLYWDATRAVLDKTGKMPIHYTTDAKVVQNVVALESRQPALDFRGATCRFPAEPATAKETYIQQAYVKLIERARSEVLIANAYFVPTPSLFTALNRCREALRIGQADLEQPRDERPAGDHVGRPRLLQGPAGRERVTGGQVLQEPRRRPAHLGMGRPGAGRALAQPGHDAFEVRGLRCATRPRGFVQSRRAQRETQQRDGGRVPAARSRPGTAPEVPWGGPAVRTGGHARPGGQFEDPESVSSDSASPWGNASRSISDAHKTGRRSRHAESASSRRW